MEGEKDKITEACNNCGQCLCSGLKEKVKKASADIAEDLKGGQEGENKEGNGEKESKPWYYPYESLAERFSNHGIA